MSALRPLSRFITERCFVLMAANAENLVSYRQDVVMEEEYAELSC
jgi:hypothetical protein